MPSEYDFLSPFSRRLRRAGLAVIGIGAFLAGAVSMAAIVALPLFPVGGSNKTPATEAKLSPAQPEETARPATAERDTTAKTPPATPTSDAAHRETTGSTASRAPASSAGTLPDGKPATPQASPSKDTSAAAAAVSAPTAPTTPSEASGGASVGEANASSAHAGTRAADSPTTSAPAASPAPTGSEASPRAKKKSTASRTRRERVARSRQRQEEYRSTGAFGERRAGREYVDGSGVRYYVVPRSAQSAFAYDDAPRTRRIIVVRPGGPFNDDD